MHQSEYQGRRNETLVDVVETDSSVEQVFAIAELAEVVVDHVEQLKGRHCLSVLACLNRRWLKFIAPRIWNKTSGATHSLNEMVKQCKNRDRFKIYARSIHRLLIWPVAWLDPATPPIHMLKWFKSLKHLVFCDPPKKDIGVGNGSAEERLAVATQLVTCLPNTLETLCIEGLISMGVLELAVRNGLLLRRVKLITLNQSHQYMNDHLQLVVEALRKASVSTLECRFHGKFDKQCIELVAKAINNLVENTTVELCSLQCNHELAQQANSAICLDHEKVGSNNTLRQLEIVGWCNSADFITHFKGLRTLRLTGSEHEQRLWVAEQNTSLPNLAELVLGSNANLGSFLKLSPNLQSLHVVGPFKYDSEFVPRLIDALDFAPQITRLSLSLHWVYNEADISFEVIAMVGTKLRNLEQFHIIPVTTNQSSILNGMSIPITTHQARTIDQQADIMFPNLTEFSPHIQLELTHDESTICICQSILNRHFPVLNPNQVGCRFCHS